LPDSASRHQPGGLVTFSRILRLRLFNIHSFVRHVNYRIIDKINDSIELGITITAAVF